MSVQAQSWARNVTGWLGDVDPGRLTTGAALVLWDMADYAVGPTWTCAPTMERLAHETGQTLEDVFDAIDLLIELGIITMAERVRTDAQRNYYRADGTLGRLASHYIRFWIQREATFIAGHPVPIDPMFVALKAQIEADKKKQEKSA